MPYYNIKRMSDLKVLSESYPNDAEALVGFGRELGVTLTLEQGPNVAEYMMGCREESLGWVKTDIPVYAVRP